MDPNYRKL